MLELVATTGGRLDWPGSLALATALGLAGDMAADLLAEGERGMIAGHRKLMESESKTDG